MASERGKEGANIERGKASITKEYNEFQKATSWYMHAHEANAPELSYLTLGLVGEAGEFADEFKKMVRKSGFLDTQAFLKLMADPRHRTSLHKELGDTLWYLNRLIHFLGLDMEMVMVMNTYKLYRRLKGTDPKNPQRPEFADLEWPFTNPDYSWEVIHEQFKDIGD
jgi:NTP pyrophosphatase (non-canonical NTP hydrolase)